MQQRFIRIKISLANQHLIYRIKQFTNSTVSVRYYSVFTYFCARNCCSRNCRYKSNIVILLDLRVAWNIISGNLSERKDDLYILYHIKWQNQIQSSVYTCVYIFCTYFTVFLIINNKYTNKMEEEMLCNIL